MRYREKESKVLLEVRKWKREVAKQASKLHGQELADYYNASLKYLKKSKHSTDF